MSTQYFGDASGNKDAEDAFCPRIIKTGLDKTLKNFVEFYVKMFLLFSGTLLEKELSIVEIDLRRLFAVSPLWRFGSSRPSLRKGLVLE